MADREVVQSSTVRLKSQRTERQRQRHGSSAQTPSHDDEHVCVLARGSCESPCAVQQSCKATEADTSIDRVRRCHWLHVAELGIAARSLGCSSLHATDESRNRSLKTNVCHGTVLRARSWKRSEDSVVRGKNIRLSLDASDVEHALQLLGRSVVRDVARGGLVGDAIGEATHVGRGTIHTAESAKGSEALLEEAHRNGAGRQLPLRLLKGDLEDNGNVIDEKFQNADEIVVFLTLQAAALTLRHARTPLQRY